MKKTNAFSLLEGLFCLLIVGFFSIFLNQLYDGMTKGIKTQITKDRANYIRKTIQGYVATYGFLPYAAESLNGLESNKVVIGYLPYKTLGISKDYAYDGFDNAFIFIVNENFVLKYHESNNWIIMPPFILDAYYIRNAKSWGKLGLYKHSSGKKIEKAERNSLHIYLFDYDDIDENLNIELFSNSHPLKLANIRRYPILQPNQVNILKNKPAQLEKDRTSYLMNDAVVWVLISDKSAKVTNLKIEISNFYLVFWQSRFHLAAQIKNPINCMGTILDIASIIKYKPAMNK